MRLLIITSIFPPDIGGPATYVSAIALALVKRGHIVTVITLSERVETNDQAYPFTVIRIHRRLFKPLRWVVTWLTVIRFARRCELVYANGLALETALAKLIFRKPLILKVVGDLVWERASNLGWVDVSFEEFQHKRYGTKLESLKALRNWWTRQADLVITPSHYLASWVVNWQVSKHKIRVIHNAVARSDKAPRLSIPLHTPLKVATIGRLVRWKCVDQLIEAMVGLPELGLVIVGEGPEKTRLEDLANSLGISGRVYWAGSRCAHETAALLAESDIFVLNSTYEGFPHVVLEAVSVGVPVVATGAGGTPELIEDGVTGILVKQNDVKGLCEAIGRLASSRSLRQTLAMRAKQSIESRFSWARMVDLTEDALLAAASQTSRQSLH